MVDSFPSKPDARLLVVDDERDLMLALVAALEAEGYDVIGCGSSSEALAALRAGSYDALITDLMLPGLDGIGLLRAGLALDPNLVGLIMTGKGTVSTAVEALKLGAFDYLQKPFTVETVLSTVAHALDLRRVRLENVQLREAVALHQFSQAISATLDAAHVAQLTATAAQQQLGADTALVLRREADALVVAATAYADTTDHADTTAPAPASATTPAPAAGQLQLAQRLPLSASLAAWLAQPGEPLRLPQGGPSDGSALASLFPQPPDARALAVHMLAGGHVVGVLAVSGPRLARPFAAGQVKALALLANAGAAALENAALVDQLRASELRAGELIEHASDGILLFDAGGVCLAANTRLLEWLGRASDEVTGHRVRELILPEDRPAMLAEFAALQASPLRVGRGEMRLLRNDGTLLATEFTARRTPDGDFQAIVRDMTERKQAEQALKASESRYRELIEHASDGIATIDSDSNYVEANSVLLGWLGYTRDELLRLSTRQVVQPDDQPQLQQGLADMRAGQPILAEQRLRRKDGSYLLLELSGRQLPDGNFQAIMRNVTQRRQAERALRESETRLAIMFQASPAAITVTTLREGRYVDVNAEFERLMGYSREELIGHTVAEVGTWAQPADRQWVVNELAQHRPIHNMEQRFRRKSGEVLDMLLSLERIELSGEPYLLGLLLDITDRKRAEQALRDSESRFAALFQASPAAIILSSLDGRIVDVNQEFERALGYTRAEAVGQMVRDLNLWTAPEERERLLRQLQARGALVNVEVHYRRKSGDIMPALISMQTVTLAGQPYLLTLALDNTERKQAEERLRFQAGLLAAVGQAVIATDPQGRIVYWNHMAEKLYGWTADEVRDQSTARLTPDSADRAPAKTIIALVRAGQTWSGEWTMRRRDGSTFPAAVTDTPYYDEQGVLAGIIGMSSDISERKQREREMEAIGQLSAALRAALTAEQIPAVILDQLQNIFDATAASLDLLYPATHELKTELAIGLWARYTGERVGEGDGIAGHVSATGQPYVTQAATEDPILYPREAAQGVVSVAVLPMITHGQTIGTLAAGRTAPFGESDLRLLSSIADITANALQRATLHEQTQLRADQLAGVNDLARALAETLQLAQIYERLDTATRQLLPGVNSVTISLIDPAQQAVTAVYRAENGQPLTANALASALAGALEPALDDAHGQVVETRQTVVFNQAGLGWSLLAPLQTKGEVVGVLQASRPEAAGAFERDEANLLATVASTAAVAIENARLFAETQRRLLRLQALRTIDLAITSSMDSHISLRVLVDQCMTHLEVDAVDVLLLDSQTHRLELAAGRGFRTVPPRFSLRVDEGLAGQAFMERRLLRVPRLTSTPTHTVRDAWFAAEGFATYFGMPLVAKGAVRGVLEVFQRAPLAPDEEWLDFLETLGEQAAIAVDNSLLFADLQRSNTDLELAYDTTLEGWSRALDLRDKETEGHTQRVTEVTERLAGSMGLSETELMQIRRGGLLHDIGKMGIPDSILLKPGPLTAEEWAIMRKHPLYAFELLAPIAYLRPALDIPYCHHEKWDGSGYPRQLKGEAIPLSARIFAVVDVWDALRSDRPYRPAWPEEQVREHIRGLAGTHFDPRVVQAFLALPV